MASANVSTQKPPVFRGATRRSKGVERREHRQLQEIIDRFGTPLRLNTTGCTVLVFEVDPYGDTALMARLSKRDLKGGETAMGQIEEGQKVLAAQSGRRVRYIVVATQLSGGLSYERRPDLLYLEELIGAGEISAVFFRDADRMARDVLVLAMLQALLEGTDTDLYLHSPEGKLDWSEFSDRIMLSINGTISVVEREKIRSRTHGAIYRQYLREGRGVGSHRPLGFCRNVDKYLEQDPSEWPYIEKIHLGFYECKEGGEGLKGFAQRLRDEYGLEYSHEQLRRILTDEIYVTGYFTTTWKGEVYEGRVENFKNGIPRHVFERNRVVLAATEKRPNKRTPLGLFGLAPVIYCAKCGRRLDGRIQSESRSHIVVYRHRPTAGHPVPEQCRGDTYERSVLDPFVFEQLRRLDDCEELREQWWKNAWSEEGARGLPQELRERESELNRQLEGLLARARELWERRSEKLLEDDDAIDVDPSAEAVLEGDRECALLQREIKQVRRQIAVLPGLLEHRGRKRLDLTRSSPELRKAFKDTLDAGIAGTAHEDLETGAKLIELVKSCLTRVVVDRHIENGEEIYEVQLFGPAVPSDTAPLRALPPHRNAACALGFASARAVAAMGAQDSNVQTVNQDYSWLTVRTAWRSEVIRVPRGR
jgi:DNA invertase Pin-like site-specific DNA recombinase